MLPILAVLLGIAQLAVAAPSVGATAYLTNEFPDVTDNGRFVNRFLVSGPLAYVDAADGPFYIKIIEEVIAEMANSNSVTSQARAVINTLALLGELVSGIAGDSCDTAAFINAYVYAVKTGNQAALQQAVAAYVGRLSIYIDLITQLLVNPNSVKYTTGPRGSCLGGGRTYQFDEVWNDIIDKANVYDAAFLVEVNCDVRRMYNAFSITSNNVAAALTATSTPAITQLAQYSLNSLVQFLRVVGNGNNPSQVAVTLKSNLAQAVSRVTC